MTAEFDVIICGAGPAGCTAALALGSSGLNVALIEKESFPREKVCGDALPAYIPKVLNTINPDYSKAYDMLPGRQKINACRISAPNGREINLKFRESGYICRRTVFDQFLFGLASGLSNIAVLQETMVSGLKYDNGTVIVNTGKNAMLKTKLVIGADGAHSQVKRDLTGLKNELKNCSGAARGYFKNVTCDNHETIELIFLKDLLPGYFWIFPLTDNNFNVGLGLQSTYISKNKINLEKELLRIIQRVPYLKNRFSDSELISDIKGHILPLSFRKIPISGERFMLCGDAASLINPATGAGIGQSMQSGRFAGWQALKCFESNNFSAEFMKGYDNSVYEKIGNENNRYSIIHELILKHDKRLNFIVRAGAKFSFLNKMIAENI